MILIIILLILLILIYIGGLIYKEKFVLCNNKPTGPFETKCNNIEFKDNTLNALCIADISDNTFVSTQLDLKKCIKDNNDCDSINVNNMGNLICE